MERRRAVQQNRMLADDFFKDVPDFRTLFFHHALGGLDRGRHAVEFELRVDERLEQFERHLLRNAALVQLQFRTDDDDRTARVIDALAEKVLTEAALLAFEHIGQRLQGTLVGARDGAAATAVVEQRIDRFLEHALFVADDDFRRAEFDQALQTVVAVDDAAIEIVEIRGRETAAVERHERTQLGRDDRNDFHDHPFRTRARDHEALDELQALHELLALCFRAGFLELDAHFVAQFLEVDRGENLTDGFGADAVAEAIFAVFFDSRAVLIFRQQFFDLQRGHARFDDDVVFEIQNALEILQRHIEQKADAARQRLHEPDVGNRRGQFDVAHALAAHLRKRDFNAALFADDALVLHALVFAAQAFVILDRSKDTRAEQAVTLGLERTVVDGFGLLDLAVGPRADLLGARDRDADLVEGLSAGDLAKDLGKFVH